MTEHKSHVFRLVRTVLGFAFALAFVSVGANWAFAGFPSNTPVASISTDGGPDGGVITNQGGKAGWGVGGASGVFGVDTVKADGGTRVISAQNGAIGFADSGIISCAPNDEACALAAGAQTEDIASQQAALIGGNAYSDAAVNVNGGNALIMTGKGSNVHDGGPGYVCLDPSGGKCASGGATEIAQTGSIRSPNNLTAYVRNGLPGDTRWLYWSSPAIIFGNDTDSILETVIEGYSLIELQDAYNDHIVIADGISLEPAGGAGTFSVVNAATSYGNSANDTMVQTTPLSVTTTDATPNASMVFVLPANSGGPVVVIVSGKVPSSANVFTQTWNGAVYNNGGTCAVMGTGGTFASSAGAAYNGTLSTAASLVGLTGTGNCTVQVEVAGVAATTINWTSVLQYQSAGP